MGVIVQNKVTPFLWTRCRKCEFGSTSYCHGWYTKVFFSGGDLVFIGAPVECYELIENIKLCTPSQTSNNKLWRRHKNRQTDKVHLVLLCRQTLWQHEPWSRTACSATHKQQQQLQQQQQTTTTTTTTSTSMVQDGLLWDTI